MRYRLAHKPYRLPLRIALRTAHGPWTEREGLLLRLEDDTGRVGWGEVAPIPWFGSETLAEAHSVLARLGDEPDDEQIDAVPERCGCLRFALACARGGTAAAERARDAAAAASRLPVAALLPAGRAALEQLRSRLEAGYLAFKWKVGVEPVDDELGLLADLLGELPAYARLRLDANGAWNRRQAGRWLERCAGLPVEFVEQPVAPDDEDTLLGLAGDYPVTLALDESVVRLAEAKRWQSLGWPGVYVIKPALCGPLQELGDWARETAADLVISSAIETPVGRGEILRWATAGGATKRALGFGLGEVFAGDEWNNPPIGPLADPSLADRADPGKIWSLL